MDELQTWAKVADMDRTTRAITWRNHAEMTAPGIVWRALHVCPPVIESPRADARRILNRWLAACKAATRIAQTA